MVRALIPEAIPLIAGIEKCSLTVYHGGADAKGVDTVGFGHVLGPGDHWMRNGITAEQAHEIFNQDIADHIKFIESDLKAPKPVDDYAFAALADLGFNCGPRILLSAASVVYPIRDGNVKRGISNLYKFCNSDNIYRDGLFYRRLVAMYFALAHKLVKKPDHCKEAKALIALLKPLMPTKEYGDMTSFFAKKHRRDLCISCKRK